MSDYTDQREPGLTFERNNPNWTDRFKKENEKYDYNPQHNDFKDVVLLKNIPEYKEDVLDLYNQSDLKINNKIDTFKYCIDNKIPFLLFNGKIYDWDDNIINVDYFDLPTKSDFIFSKKLSKNIIFVKYYEPFDCMKNLGQLVVEITYINGDIDTLSTKSTKENVFASFDFNDENEFYKFIKFLQKNDIPRKKY